jgi:hypothetical protein
VETKKKTYKTKIRAEALQEIAAHLLAPGASAFSSYEHANAIRGMMGVSKQTYTSMSSIVWSVVTLLSWITQKDFIDDLRAREEKLVLCLDGGWAHRGYDSDHGAYIALEFHSQKPIATMINMRSRKSKGKLVFRGNYEGSSKSMEAESFAKLLDMLRNEKLIGRVQYFIMDKDSAVWKMANEDEQLRAAGVTCMYDPGHYKKNVSRAIIEVCRKNHTSCHDMQKNQHTM